ncbi:MAG TPA: hypothetical protein PK765_03880 [bacterium]|nr:hypothetical protein [bacterium]
MTFSHQHTASIAMEDFRRDMQQRGFEPAVTRLISQLPTKQPTWAPPPIDLIVLPDIGESSTGSTQESALPDTMESTVDLAETTTPQDTLTTTSEIPPPTIGSMHSFPRLL